MQRGYMGPKPNAASERSTGAALKRSHHVSLDPTQTQHPLLILQSKIGNQAVLRQLRQQSPETLAPSSGGPSCDFSPIPIFPPERCDGASQCSCAVLRRPAFIQPKLKVGAVDDPLEHDADRREDDPWAQEADRVADEMVRTTEPPALLNKPAETPRVLGGPVLARQPQNRASQPLDTGTATAEREREVEAINVRGTNYVLYQTKVRGGGSSSWLANNPGNLDYTADTVAWGCYEDKKLFWGAHRFAIFQDESTGLAAVRAFLRKNQTTRNITLMMNLFAPAGDLKNNPTQYSEKVAKWIGPPVTVNSLVKDLTDDQIQLFAEAIKEQEGWTPGPVNDFPRGDPSLPDEIRNR